MASTFIKLPIENIPLWDDMLGQVISKNLDTTSGRIDYDYTNLGIAFANNTRYPNEVVGIPFQFSHRAALKNKFRVHIHWLQEQAAVPNMLIEYRFYNNGELAGSYLKAITTEELFAWTSGSLLQISTFPEIDVPNCLSSASLDVKLYRDVSNATGLFTGVDPVSTAVTVKFLDVHYIVDTDGSRQEYTK